MILILSKWYFGNMQMKTEMPAQSNNGYVRHQESEIGNCA